MAPEGDEEEGILAERLAIAPSGYCLFHLSKAVILVLPSFIIAAAPQQQRRKTTVATTTPAISPVVVSLLIDRAS